MVDKARERGVYDELRIGELTAALAEERAAYDLIVSADVLVYFGDLTPVFVAVARALRPNGIVAFSVERVDGPGFVLRTSGRYAHSAAFLREVARLAGLDEASLDERLLRIEGNSLVRGYVGVYRQAQRALRAGATWRRLVASQAGDDEPAVTSLHPGGVVPRAAVRSGYLKCGMTSLQSRFSECITCACGIWPPQLSSARMPLSPSSSRSSIRRSVTCSGVPTTTLSRRALS
jgi:SAM-dependent methyltransferase